MLDARYEYAVNVSDSLPDNRALHDVRPTACKAVVPARNLPGTAVVVVALNEAHSVLRRTLASVVRRSPRVLLREVVVVDDASDIPVDLQAGPARLVRVLRNTRREGIVRSRLRGVFATTAPTITFLDAHVECNIGWLEPLLARVADNPTVLIAPQIDVINPATFEYASSGMAPMRGAFSWELDFKWIPQVDGSAAGAPIRTPALAGGLFTVDRNFFLRLGTYDDGMEVWGGENLELSFRAWMCGGSLEIHPCSHVGQCVFPRKTELGGHGLRLPRNADATTLARLLAGTALPPLPVPPSTTAQAVRYLIRFASTQCL